MTVWLSGFKADATKAGAGVVTNSALPVGSNPTTVFGEQEGGEQPTPVPDRGAILSDFYSEVCREAEGIMAQSGMVSGAHWNAMRRVLQRHGVEVSE